MILNTKTYKSLYLNGKRYTKGFYGGKQVFGDTYDVSTLALINFANSNGFALPTNMIAIDDLIKGMKTIGIWNLLDRFFLIFGDGSTNFKRINIIDPSKTLGAFFGGGTFDNGGFKGNGINAYFSASFNPSMMETGQLYQQNDASYFVVVTEAFTSVSALASNTTNTVNVRGQILNSNSVSQRINSNTGNLNSPGDFSGTGLKLINRTSANDVSLINKDVLFSRTQTVGAIYNDSYVVLRSGTSTFGDAKVGCFGAGKSIPFPISQDFRIVINNYLTSIGQSAIA